MAAGRRPLGPSAAETALTPVDDIETLDALLTGELEDTRIGGEDQAQYAEFLRSRRLGRTARQPAGRTRGRSLARLTAKAAAERFAHRLRQLGHHGRPTGDESDEGPAGAGEPAAELAESCLEYASGELEFPGLLDELAEPNSMAQVTE